MLKNALDFVYAEWNDKAAGIVSYGGGDRRCPAAEQLRLILGELQIADVSGQVALSFRTDFDRLVGLHAGILAAQGPCRRCSTRSSRGRGHSNRCGAVPVV